jgi:hypothetical protein
VFQHLLAGLAADVTVETFAERFKESLAYADRAV